MKHLSSFEIFDLYSESWEQRPVTGEGILNNVERAMFAVSVRVSDLCSYCDSSSGKSCGAVHGEPCKSGKVGRQSTKITKFVYHMGIAGPSRLWPAWLQALG